MANNINDKRTLTGARTLEQVVASCMNKKNNYSKRDRMRLLQFAIEGYREFNIYHKQVVAMDWIKVGTDIPTVPLPDQMMKFLAVGIPVDGRFWGFTEIDNGIIPQGTNGFNQLNEERQEADVDAPVPYGNYAFPGGQNLYNYSYERERRRLIIYTPIPLQEVLVIYNSTGIQDAGKTLIPIHAFRALRSYIEWEDAQAMDEPTGKIQYREMVYLNDVKNMRDIENLFTVDQLLDAVRSGYGQTFKR